MPNITQRTIKMSLPAVALCAVTLLLAACGTTPRAAGPLPPGYLYQTEFSFVRIEPIESGAPDNAHPAAIQAPALRQTLAALTAARSISIGPKPVFTSDELDQIVAPLTAALAKAGPREDVVFASRGLHGLFGEYSPATITTGRLFVQDGRINVIFGLMHEQYDNLARGADVVRTFVPGSRTRRIETGWELAAGEAASVQEGRPDWIAFGVPSAAAATPARAADQPQRDSEAAPSAPVDSTRYEEIERKLKLLDRLKANGLVTDEEYREKRRVILQDL